MVSKAPLNGLYQKTLEALARLPEVDLLAVVPPYWNEDRVGVVRLERRYTAGYQLVAEPMILNGHHHLHLYPGLWAHARRFRPDILHIEEEPYNVVTLHTALIGRMLGAKVVFVSWQNLFRRYPPPFSLFERLNYLIAAAGIAGNQDAADILRRKGYPRHLEVIPQLGVDPEIFHPLETVPPRELPIIGYAGRLVPEKGADLVLDALARLTRRAQIYIIGDGSERLALEQHAASLGIRDRVSFRGIVSPDEMPKALGELDILVVPSRTRANWKEQFGRVIIEAMACEVPVVGSDSGEIPHVIGEGGLIFPEGNVTLLARRLDELLANDELRREIGRLARRRVLTHYTPETIAERNYALYRTLIPASNGGAPKRPRPARGAGH
jgi:glycosyltransferase involved in cell wall biosynthesis